MQTVEQRIRNKAMLEQRERAGGRVVRGFVSATVGILGILLVLTEWASPTWFWAAWLVVATACTAYGAGTMLIFMSTAYAAVEPDEFYRRSFSETKPLPGLKIVQIDGKTLRMTDLELTDTEADLVAQRLHRARWHWSRRVLGGYDGEEAITNLNGRYSKMHAEMIRVGALQSENGRNIVAAWAREHFIAASPTLQNQRRK